MNTTREIALGALRLGGGNPLFLIAGPCVIESEKHARMMAEKIAKIAADAGVPYIYKTSYDKANRSSVKAFRGPGLKEGLRILGKIKSELKLPILSDIHDASQAEAAAEVCDVLQIPAFLARQTDLLIAAGHGQRSGESGEYRQYKNHPHGTRRFLWLPESCCGHALVPDPAADRLPGGF